MSRTLLVCVVLLGLACGSPTDNGAANTLIITPNPVFLAPGAVTRLVVSDTDASGHELMGFAVSFSSSDPAVATVEPDGTVRGRRAGLTNIIAWSGLAVSHVPVLVTSTLAGIQIRPNGVALHPHDTAQFTAVLIDSGGRPTRLQPKFIYMSGNPAVATVDEKGLARSVGPLGQTFIGVSGAGFFSSVTLAVVDSSVLNRLYLAGSPAFLGVSGATSYVARPFSNKVQVLNLTNDTFTDSITVGSVPCGVVFNQSGTRAYVANQYSDNVSVIDVATKTVIATIALHGDPLPVIMPKGDSVLFVTTNANFLFKINTLSNTVVDSLPLPATSHHMFVHPNDSLLYVATRDGRSVIELNWRTWGVTRTFDLGAQTLGMEMAPDHSELYVTSGGPDSLYTINLGTGTITGTALSASASTIALNAAGTQIYVGMLFAGEVEVLDRATRAHVKTIFTGGTVRDMATDVARNRVIVTNEGGWVDFVR